MKNGLLVLNVVLLLAVGVLFYLHFSGKKNSSLTPSHANATPSKDCKVAYFEMDSVENAFVLVKDVKDELTREDNRINNILARMQKQLNDKMIQYQSQAKTMTSVESDKANRDILQMRQTFAESQQKMQQDFQGLQMRRRQEVNKMIMDYLKEYNKEKGFAYILSYEPGLIFYRDTTLNITDDLLQGLNEKYKKK